jgi:hypothetical protein
VDYLGLAEELKAALATYTESGGTGRTAIDQAEAVALMLGKYEARCGLFHRFDWSPWNSGTAGVSAPTSTIRPRRIMDAGEVLLVDLSRAGGDNAWLFGGLVIARYYVDALGRQAMAPAARVPHTLYVDEVQNFDTSAIRGMLAEGRKFALQAGLATQYFDSLGRELQRGIRANVATTMLLQPSADDARLLRHEMAPLTERDLLNLPRYPMAVRTELGGQTRVLTADVLAEPPSLGSADLVRRLSNARDGRATVT